MKLMARICCHACEAELAIDALREQGFTVLTHTFPDEPDHRFLEAMCDREGDAKELAEEMLREVAHIVGRNGSVDDAGPVPPGHVPFEYETTNWRSGH